MKSLTYILILSCLLMFNSCCKEETKIITNTIIVRDTFINVRYLCDSMKNWNQVQILENYKQYSVLLADSLQSNYEFVNASIAELGNGLYRVLPYTNIVDNFTIRYNIQNGYFRLIAYGDTNKINSSALIYYAGFSLKFRKK